MAEQRYLTLFVNDAMSEVRLKGLSLAARGMWVTLGMLAAQYPCKPAPGDPTHGFTSMPMTRYRIAKLVGSSPATVRKLMDELEVAGLVTYTRNDTIFLPAGIITIGDL